MRYNYSFIFSIFVTIYLSIYVRLYARSTRAAKLLAAADYK